MSSDLVLNGGYPVDPAIRSGLIELLKVEARNQAALEKNPLASGRTERDSEYWANLTEVVCSSRAGHRDFWAALGGGSEHLLA
jgi:hypothetical protein